MGAIHWTIGWKATRLPAARDASRECKLLETQKKWKYGGSEGKAKTRVFWNWVQKTEQSIND
jgi:hypothetical protein